MNTNDFLSNTCFSSKNDNNELVSFLGQSITFRFSVKEV